MIFISILLATTGLKAQSNINFAYDAAGNRVSRTISLGSTKSAIGGDGIVEFETVKNFFTETLAEKKIKIYPNPTRGLLRVDILGYEDLNKNSTIQVFTNAGTLLYKTVALSQTTVINMTNEPTGLYLMVIIIEGERSTWKIIKQ